MHPLRRRAEDAVDLFRGFRFAMVFENRLSPRSQGLRLTGGELESYLGPLMIMCGDGNHDFCGENELLPDSEDQSNLKTF